MYFSIRLARLPDLQQGDRRGRPPGTEPSALDPGQSRKADTRKETQEGPRMRVEKGRLTSGLITLLRARGDRYRPSQ